MKTSPVILIMAAGTSGQIGLNQGIPWHLPEDLKHFKDLTQGHTIIMGRKTFESIGRPLPSRDNIVVSRRLSYLPGASIAASLSEALEKSRPGKKVFIIGGTSLWQEALPLSDSAIISLVDYQGPSDCALPTSFFNEIRDRFRLHQLKQKTGFTITEWVNPLSQYA